MKRGERSIVAIDLETGGFDPEVHALLMIGCYWTDFRGHARGLLIRVERDPDKEVVPEAAQKCGYVDDEQWASLGSVPVGVALDKLIVWLDGMAALTGGVMEPLAHNGAAADRPFLEAALKEHDLGDLVFENPDRLLSHAWHDSMHALRACQTAGLVDVGPGASLNALMRLSGQSCQLPVHNALSDAEACFRGYAWLLQRMERGLV